MHKTYLILLSSFIACSSRAMDQSSSSVPSLKQIAALNILQEMDNRLRMEVAFQQAVGSIDGNQVYEIMRQKLDKLELGEDAPELDSLIQLYRQVYKRYDADLCDQQLGQCCVRSIDFNADHTKIAVGCGGDSQYNVQIWEEDAGGFQKTIGEVLKKTY